MLLKKYSPIVFLISFCFVASLLAQPNIENIIKRLGEKIEKVQKIVDKSGNPRAKEVLAKGVELYRKGIELHKAGKDREALRALNESSKLVQRAKVIALGQNPQNIEKLIKRLGLHIRKVNQLVKESGNAQAAEVLNQGIEHYKKGVDLYKAGNPRQALRELQAASKLVSRAEAIAKSQIQLNQKIKRLGQQIRKVQKLVDESGNQEAVDVLAQGIEHYKKAVALSKEGKIREAEKELNIAARLVAKAKKLAGGR